MEARAALLHRTADGLVIVQGSRVWMADDARAIVRVVASVFDAWSRREEARHSMAVRRDRQIAGSRRITW
jgi:hypothetical protein